MLIVYEVFFSGQTFFFKSMKYALINLAFYFICKDKTLFMRRGKGGRGLIVGRGGKVIGMNGKWKELEEEMF